VHVNEQRSSHPDQPGAGGLPAAAPEPGRRTAGSRPARRRWLTAAAWAGGGLALFFLFLRISYSSPVNSDGANIAAQGWDLLHGHLLMHGWIVADASYYTFEVPLLAICESLLGLTTTACHVASALVYVIVAGFAVALARTGSRGLATVARAGVVAAVLAAPILTQQGASVLLEAPQHIGTSAFLLASFLLLDRATGRGFTPPLLAVVLAAGQLADATVLYVAVPAVLVVCGYRMLAARKVRTAEGAVAVAAIVSVPLEYLVRLAMIHLGGYSLIQPKTTLAPVGQWPAHLVLAWRNVCTLFGSLGAEVLNQGSAPTGLTALFGLACLLAAAFGLVKVLWTRRTASRTEQLAVAAIVVNLVVFTVSTIPTPLSAREIAVVLPCGAVLAARGCVPGRIADAAWAASAAGFAALAALLPLASAAATLPKEPVWPTATPLAVWLKDHRLTYGIGAYWDATAVTMQSGGQVQVRAVVSITPRAGQAGVPAADWWGPGKISAFYWETRQDWYDPAQHDATFVIANGQVPDSAPLTSAEVEHAFGRPAATYQVAGHEIMVYRMNLLRRLGPPLLPAPVSTGP
jgi:hypothetical protein